MGSSMGQINNEVRKVIKDAIRRGWVRVKEKKRHIVLRWTNGKCVTISSSPSDVRSHKNMLADIRRAERSSDK